MATSCLCKVATRFNGLPNTLYNGHRIVNDIYDPLFGSLQVTAAEGLSLDQLFPGCVGGEKVAWYWMLVHAWPFLEYFCKIVSFTLSVHVDHILTKYLRSNLRTCTVPSQRLQRFSIEIVIQKCKPSIPLLSSVMWDCSKIGLFICMRYFSCPVDSANGLQDITATHVWKHSNTDLWYWGSRFMISPDTLYSDEERLPHLLPSLDNMEVKWIRCTLLTIYNK